MRETHLPLNNLSANTQKKKSGFCLKRDEALLGVAGRAGTHVRRAEAA